MIFNSIVNLLVGIFNWILNYFSDANLDTIIIIRNSIYNVKSYAAGFNWIFPVYEFFVLIQISIALVTAILVFRLSRWLLGILSAGLFR